MFFSGERAVVIQRSLPDLSLYLFQFGDVCNKGDSGTFVFGVFGLGAGEDTYNVEVKTQAFLPYRLDLSLISQTKGLVTN